jgi:hypothetical protein
MLTASSHTNSHTNSNNQGHRQEYVDISINQSLIYLAATDLDIHRCTWGNNKEDIKDNRDQESLAVVMAVSAPVSQLCAAAVSRKRDAKPALTVLVQSLPFPEIPLC